MAWTYFSKFANLSSCVVKGFLALGPVRSGVRDTWEPGLGAEMVHLFGTGVSTVRRTEAFCFDTSERFFKV